MARLQWDGPKTLEYSSNCLSADGSLLNRDTGSLSTLGELSSGLVATETTTTASMSAGVERALIHGTHPQCLRESSYLSM